MVDGLRLEAAVGVKGCLPMTAGLASPKPFRRGRSGAYHLRTATAPPSGFSLLELLVVLGIVGVLATLALPSYQGYMKAATVKEGAMSLLAFALLQERLRLTHGEYKSVPVLLTYQPLSKRLRQHYRLSAAVSRRSSEFVLSLIPTAAAAGYPTLTLNSRGQRAPAQYWP